MKTYTQAPLPFQGQKRGFVKAFREVVKSLPDNTIFVDFFGALGLKVRVEKIPSFWNRDLYKWTLPKSELLKIKDVSWREFGNLLMGRDINFVK